MEKKGIEGEVERWPKRRKAGVKRVEKKLGHVRLSLSLSAADPKKRRGHDGRQRRMKARARRAVLAAGTRDFAKLFDPRLAPRAFIPTRRATPPLASLGQHPARRIQAVDWPAPGDHVRPRWGGSEGFLGKRASRGITSLLASTAAGGEEEPEIRGMEEAAKVAK